MAPIILSGLSSGGFWDCYAVCGIFLGIYRIIRPSAIRFVAGGVFHFDLEGGVLDILMQQFVFDLMFQLFDKAPYRCSVDDEVGREGVLGGADRPDMDMMKVLYSFDPADRLPDLFYLDAFGYAIQGEAQAVPQQLPGAEQDDDGDEQAQCGVYPVLMGIDR